METLGKRIKRFRGYTGKSQQELAFHCGGLKKASVSAWESDKTRPSLDALLSLVDLFGITLDELVYGHSQVSLAPDPKGLVPLISWVRAGAAGEPIDLNEPNVADEWIPCTEPHSPQTYALRVEGHSMTNTSSRSYPEGRIIICDPEQRGGVSTGQRVIARLTETGMVTFKELVLEDGIKWLRSLNPHPQYVPITDDFEILALVIASYIPE